MRFNFATLILFTVSIYLQFGVNYSGYAQTEPSKESFWARTQIGVTLSAGQNEQAISQYVLRNWHLGKKERFKIGLGLRHTNYFTQKQNYETAPAIITSNQEGPQVLFVETFRGNIDTVFVERFNTNSFNLFINLEYAISPKFDIGFNIDAVGFSYGPTERSTYISSNLLPNQDPILFSRPTPFNLLLISDNDIGSLNSEFFLRYNHSDKWSFLAAFSFLFSELTTDRKPDFFNNDRFRRKASMGSLGVVYRPFL